MKVLLDPFLFTNFPPIPAREERFAFWARLVDWAADGRAVVGVAGYEYVYERYAAQGYPHDDLGMYPDALRTEYRRALNTLLARVFAHVRPADPRTTDPVYVADPDAGLALGLDAAGTAGTEVCGIGTDHRHWDRPEDIITFTPPPPSSLEACVRPGQSLAAEKAHLIRMFFVGKRIHVVGGRPVDRTINALLSLTGLEEADVDWIPSEKGKPPRNLDSRWGGLQPNRDITICVTGRIGHAQSLAASKAAHRRGVPHLQVESLNEVCQALADLAMI